MKKTSILMISICIVLVSCGVKYYFCQRDIQEPVSEEYGQSAPSEPIQKLIKAESFKHNIFTITPLADYVITAKVLSKKKYCFGFSSWLCPWDIVLGWREMSDKEITKDISIVQRDRKYYYWPKNGDFPIHRHLVISCSANTHIIPKNSDILTQVEFLRVGQVVTMKGYLVKTAPVRFTSSLTRNDVGDGACEVLYLTKIIVK